jgi:hypothetical protein
VRCILLPLACLTAATGSQAPLASRSPENEELASSPQRLGQLARTSADHRTKSSGTSATCDHPVSDRVQRTAEPLRRVPEPGDHALSRFGALQGG